MSGDETSNVETSLSAADGAAAQAEEELVQRDTLVKRPGSEGGDVMSALECPCMIEGYLSKHTAGRGSGLSRWQKRWWEVRGQYLLYWPNEKAATSKSTPDAAILLTKLKSLSHETLELHLESSGKKFRLRSLETADVGKSEELTRWQQVIEKVISQASAADSGAVASSSAAEVEPGPSPSPTPTPAPAPAPAPAQASTPPSPGLDSGLAPEPLPGSATDGSKRPKPPPPAGSPKVDPSVTKAMDKLTVSDMSTAETGSGGGSVGGAAEETDLKPAPPRPGDSTKALGQRLSNQKKRPTDTEKVAICEIWNLQTKIQIVVGESDHHHPTYAVEVTKQGASAAERSAAYRFGEYRKLNESLEKDGAGIPVDFPSTFQRMKLGVRLSKAQVDNRCQQLDAWVQAAIRTPLTKTPAEQLSKFLNVRDPVLNNRSYVTLTARESS